MAIGTKLKLMDFFLTSILRVKEPTVNLSKAYDIVSRITDTKGTEINVAETKRVLAAYHAVLSTLPHSEALAIVSKGILEAEKARSKATQSLVRSAKREVRKASK